MITYIALLQGVNVGGHKPAPMADLKAMFAKLGFKDARTYIQSGNVVFRSEGKDAAKLAKAIEALALVAGGKDEISLAGTEVYILARGGYGKSVFSNTLMEKKLKVRSTTRNLETTMKLLAMTEEL
jgi:uncharacterized protein (DUF1697 family)